MDREPATEILDATYRALCRNGYADLTMQDVAAEAAVSKASIHYYYDSKENLIAAVLESLHERYTERLDSVSGTSSRERLVSLLDTLLADGDEQPVIEFRTAMLAMRAQAPYDESVRAALVEFDTALLERLRDIVATSVETGEFDEEEVDPAFVAEILTTITGAHTRQAAMGLSLDRLHDAVVHYVDASLVDDRTPEVTS